MLKRLVAFIAFLTLVPSMALGQSAPLVFNNGRTVPMAPSQSITVGGLNGALYFPTVTTGSTSAAAANASSINAAIQSAGASSAGGTVQLPCGDIYVGSSIDDNVSRVLVRGCGRDQNHNVSPFTYGTRILPTVAMTVLRHRTPSGTSTTPGVSGGGFDNLTVDGNGVGTRLLEVISTQYGTYNLFLTGSVGSEAAYFGSLVQGTTIGDTGSVQHAYINLTVRQIDGGATNSANGVVFDGSSNSNFSMNDQVYLNIANYNGDAIVCKSADNNLISAQIYRASGGTGRGLTAYGMGSNGQGCYANNFDHYSAAAGSGQPANYARGTNDGDTSGVTNVIGYLDTGNGTLAPTAGTGSYWFSTENQYNIQAGLNGTSALLGQANSDVITGRGNRCATCSLDVVNGSTDNIHVRDAGNTVNWKIGVNAPDLQILQLVGSGVVRVPSVNASGTVTAAGVTSTAPVLLQSYTVSTLPTCNAALKGGMAYVTDATAPTYNGALTGGGAVIIPVFCGTAWTAH